MIYLFFNFIRSCQYQSSFFELSFLSHLISVCYIFSQSYQFTQHFYITINEKVRSYLSKSKYFNGLSIEKSVFHLFFYSFFSHALSLSFSFFCSSIFFSLVYSLSVYSSYFNSYFHIISVDESTYTSIFNVKF